jgi:hypothetical protein
LSRVKCFANALGIVRLRDRHEFDVAHCPTGFGHRLRDLFAHTIKIFSDLGHAEL